MKKKMLLSLALALILLVSCTKKKDDIVSVINGVSVFNNSAVPENPSFSYEFIEDGIIPYTDGENNVERNFKDPSAVIEDNDNNIYVAGSDVGKIFKFSSDYKFIFSFGGIGVGPGEFEGGPSSLTYYKNRLLAPCWRNTSTNVYDTEGKFISKIPPRINAGFSGQLSFNNQMLMNTEFRKADDTEVILTSSIALIDSNFENVSKTIYTKDTRTSMRVFRVSDMYVRFAAGKDILYVGDVSEDSYKIFGYDKNYNKVMEIRKKYRSEVEQDSTAIVYAFQPDNLGGSFYRKYKTSAKNRKLYYKSINHMFVDANDRLWVVSPTKNKKDQEGLYVDIFEKGVFINTIHIPFYKDKDFSFVYSSIFMRNGKLFYVDADNQCIKVYRYEEKKAG